MTAYQIQPPARRARMIALILSGIAVLFSIGFGFMFRQWWSVCGRVTSSFEFMQDVSVFWLVGGLALLLVAVLLRMGAGICELIWLERTMSNLPAALRRVGPVENVTPIHIFGFAFIPVLAWFWKLGLVRSVSNGLEEVRKTTPFKAPVPKALGMTAIILGWFPPLSMYLAPFLWEMFARRIDVVCHELAAAEAASPENA